MVKNLLGKWVNGASRDSQEGFTLIEMSIVLAIIGLIVGGILKGQEVLNNARIKMQVSQIDSIRAAVNTFQDKYNALPGDYNAPVNLGLSATVSGNGDGIIGTSTTLTDASTLDTDTEVAEVWLELAAANLLGGVTYPTGKTAVTATTAAFQAKLGSSWLWMATMTSNGVDIPLVRIQGNQTGAPTAAMKVVDAASMDLKYDDGAPASGAIMATTGQTACATTTAYTTGTATACNLLWTMQ